MTIDFSACFIGHRKIENREQVQEKLQSTVENLIIEYNVDTFLFGSHSQFDDLCFKVVTTLKKKYPHIKRIFVRTQYPEINDYTKSLFLKEYDDTYFPPKAVGAGKYIYVERNYDMIDKSRFCVFYYDENVAAKRKSGTKIAFDYATKKKKKIINLL